MNRRIPFHLMNLILLMPVLFACRGLPAEYPSDFPRQIPEREMIMLDGNPGDWPGSCAPLRVYSDISGDIPDTSDFQVRFRLGWDNRGLLMIAEIRDDSVHEDHQRFWEGDGMEVFLSPYRGSPDIIQFSIRPSLESAGNRSIVEYYDHRRSDSLKSLEPHAEFFKSAISGGYCLEGLIGFDALGSVRPHPGEELAIQVYFNDSDREGDTCNYSLPWFPVRDSYRNPYAFQKIRLTGESCPANGPEIRVWYNAMDTLKWKIIADPSHANDKILVRSGEWSGRFGFLPGKDGLFLSEYETVPGKNFPEKGRLAFYLQDSLFGVFDLFTANRSFREIPEPNRFEGEIRVFEILDYFDPPPEHAILFTGSSTIRKWNSLTSDFNGYSLINRGFGGSTMEDLLWYTDRIVIPYNPSRIFVYEGDNDIARGKSPVEFIEECRAFVRYCNQYLPDTEIVFISIKPSPARFGLWPRMREANSMLSGLPAEHKGVRYLDITSSIMDINGMPDSSLFEPDRLHFNARGYEKLREAILTILND